MVTFMKKRKHAGTLILTLAVMISVMLSAQSTDAATYLSDAGVSSESTWNSSEELPASGENETETSSSGETVSSDSSETEPAVTGESAENNESISSLSADQTDSSSATEQTEQAEETTEDENSVESAESTELSIADVQQALTYRTHVQKIGWQGWQGNNSVAGTTGRGLRVEALEVRLNGISSDQLGIQYSAHVQNIGWQGTRKDGETAGTTGKSLRIEAINMSLTGSQSSRFDIWYRVHVQNIGWLGWAKNGENAGSIGYSYRMEAMQVLIVEKGQTPGDYHAGAASCYDATTTQNWSIAYQVHGQTYGWQSARSDGEEAGTTGKSKRLEAMKVSISADNLAHGNYLQYRAYVQKIGWQGWVSSGGVAGTTGRGLRMEAVQIKLSGIAAKKFDVYYRVHIQKYGWLGWAKNGESAGSQNGSLRMEAINIVLVPKGGSAPGSTDRHFIICNNNTGNKNLARMDSIAAGINSSTNYKILVDCTTNHLGVYKKTNGTWSRLYYWACSTGKSSTPTVKGYYRLGSKGYSFGSGYTCYYYSQIYGNYLFHSILYYQGTRIPKDSRLGLNISHGCVRLDINNAKFIYDNVPKGTAIYIY